MDCLWCAEGTYEEVTTATGTTVIHSLLSGEGPYGSSTATAGFVILRCDECRNVQAFQRDDIKAKDIQAIADLRTVAP